MTGRDNRSGFTAARAARLQHIVETIRLFIRLHHPVLAQVRSTGQSGTLVV
jgi:hypothetical protein